MQEQEQFRNAFLEWVGATKVGKASCRDRRFKDTNGKEFPIAYLLGFMSTNPEILPAEYAWIVTDNLGKEAAPSYENAVQVVRAQRQQ